MFHGSGWKLYLCLHTDFWEATSSSPEAHCEYQPEPWLFSQVWIREVCVVLPQNHEALQVWGHSMKPKLKFIRAEPCQLSCHLPGGFTANSSQSSSCKRKQISEASVNLGAKIFSRKLVETCRCTPRAAQPERENKPQLWLENPLPCRQHSFSHHRSQWTSAGVFSLLRHVQPGPFAGLIVPLQKAHLEQAQQAWEGKEDNGNLSHSAAQA